MLEVLDWIALLRGFGVLDSRVEKMGRRDVEGEEGRELGASELPYFFLVGHRKR